MATVAVILRFSLHMELLGARRPQPWSSLPERQWALVPYEL
jgi:hypothetical protein